MLSRRPDLENMLIDALELSMDDMFGIQRTQAHSLEGASAMDRELIR